VKGKRAVSGNSSTPPIHNPVQGRGAETGARSGGGIRSSASGPGIVLTPLNPTVTESSLKYSAVTLTINRDKRTADLTVQAPTGPQPSTPDEILEAGDQFWARRSAKLDVRCCGCGSTNRNRHDRRRTGRRRGGIAIDETLLAHRSHWLVREIINFMKRTLKRVDLTSRLLRLHRDRFRVRGSLLSWRRKHSPLRRQRGERDRLVADELRSADDNGLTRLQTRFLDDRRRSPAAGRGAPFSAADAEEAGLVTFAQTRSTGTTRCASPSRRARRFAGCDDRARGQPPLRGPETMERIFGG
jgi:benzoyl-CoA-dihydrodiol lyase